MKKKLSILLVICMLISMVPTSAFATVNSDAQPTNVVEDMSTETEGEGEGEPEECEHVWFVGEDGFNWAEDYSCTVVLECYNCDIVKTVTCSVTKTQTKAPTCKATGTYTYIATVPVVEGVTSTAYETIPKLSHQYNGNTCKLCGTKLLATPSATATKYSWSKIKVSWGKVTNASGYYVYRATSKSGKYTLIKTASSSSTYYLDSGRTPGKTYYYKVVAFKGSTKSTASAIKSAASGLLKPTVKTIPAVTGSSIRVYWNKTANAQGYLVYRRVGSTGSWKKVATVKGSTLNYKNSVSAGVYQYAVKAYAKVDGKTIYSSLSDPIKTRTLKTTSIKIADYDDESFVNKLTWAYVSGATGYEIYYKNGKSGTWKKKATVGKVTVYYDRTVGHGYYRYYKVRPIYSNGGFVSKGAFSKTDSVMWYYYPNIRSIMLDDWDSDCWVVPVDLTNYGVGKFRVYSAGAELLDADYYDFDRKVKLFKYVDGHLYARTYMDVPKGGSATMWFVVVGDSTWYDDETEIKFKAYYDGVYYWCYTSAYYGFDYYKID